MLTHKRVLEALSYDPKTGIFRWRVRNCWRRKHGDLAGTTNKRGYVVICLDRHLVLGHRLAWFYIHGIWPGELDHRDKVKNHNWIDNLREASTSQNHANLNAPAHNTTGFKGVYWHKKAGRYMASIKHNYKQIYLGLHDTKEAAHAAYCAKAKELFGDFAA